MIKKLACVSVMAAAVLVSAPVAEAAPAPGPSAGVPGGQLLDSLLGSLEVGHPATSPQSLLPQGILGG
ncbi:hypothetical protein EV562_12222 [Streptomyces sp. BK208]|uniref:hypothetical protein n=1 Tax=Streptomyces sp. BK208 TaxID=2512150 RepID=UPI00105D741D|nr:hypothetical protein [Streptomyces sp. BK208]TDT21931.1 hypothetical protein EV562_12222 [Streptomyces sp. BK208]